MTTGRYSLLTFCFVGEIWTWMKFYSLPHATDAMAIVQAMSGCAWKQQGPDTSAFVYDDMTRRYVGWDARLEQYTICMF